MTPLKETIELLERNGFRKIREGKHMIYWNPETKKTVPVQRHDFDEEDQRYILKEAGIKKR